MYSEDKLNTGKFFGEIDGTVLESLVKNKVFKMIKVHDYQVRVFTLEGLSLIKLIHLRGFLE